MDKYVWITDPHFDRLPEAEFVALAEKLKSEGRGAIISGDLADGFVAAAGYLKRLGVPVWYVLGNHDFYGSSVAATRMDAYKLSRAEPFICYLPASAPVLIDETTAMVGVDGWADGQLGNRETPMRLRDHAEIADYQKLLNIRHALFAVARNLGEQCARELGVLLDNVVELRDRIIVVTHVPPFAQAAWHEGAQSDDDHLPWFTCKAVGDVLLDRAEKHPTKKFLVLCGHTHSGGYVRVTDNLEVFTESAEYGKVRVHELPSFIS